jgi:uncharacterized protein (TIGR02117 family)
MTLRLVLTLLAIVALAGCQSPPPDQAAARRPPIALPPAAAQIFVIDRGWHTDIGVPVAELGGGLASLEPDFPGARYLVFGFGDRSYLLDRDPGVFAMLRALFPGRAAMLVTGLKASPSEAFGQTNVVALGMSEAGLHRLEDFIALYFASAANGQPLRLADGPYPGSRFFASDATYDAFHTCNSWVADGLKAGGLPVSGGLKIFASQVMTEARELSTRERGGP